MSAQASPTDRAIAHGGDSAEPGDASGASPRVSSPWVAALMFVLAAGLAIARLQIRGNAFNHVWAEDGKIFLTGAEQHGVASLGYLYASYLQLVSRALALIGQGILPLHDYAAYAVIASAVVVGALAAFVYLAASEVLRSIASGVVASLAIVLSPAIADAALGAIANLQWFFIYAAFWAMLLSLDSRHRISGSLVAGIGALTSPLTAFVAPVALVVHGPRRALRSRPLQTLVACIFLQLIAIAVLPSAGKGPSRNGLSASVVKNSVKDVFKKVLGPSNTSIPAPALIGVIFAALLIVGLVLAKGRPRKLALVALVTGLVIYFITCAVTGSVPSRYVGLATMFVFGAVGCIVAGLDRPLATTAIALLAVFCLISFPASKSRLRGPTWSRGVAQHEAECRTSPHPSGEIAISPEGWYARVGCPAHHT